MLLRVQTIRFDDFQVWEGMCAPENEPFAKELFKPSPEWPSMQPPIASSASVLEVDAIFEKAFVGGGCAKFEMTKTVEEDCSEFHVELHIRPSWGTLAVRNGKPTMHGVSLVHSDESAGVCVCADMLCFVWWYRMKEYWGSCSRHPRSQYNSRCAG